MTTIYFVRHSESDHSVKDNRNRPLTAKGIENCALVTDFLQDKKIDVIISSPYIRAVDTIAGYAESVGLPIHTDEDFREREHGWAEDWRVDVKKQWTDFSHKLPGEESINEVQERYVNALKDVLSKYKDKTVIIGTHGMALSALINFYDNSFGYDDFMDMAYLTPWVLKMIFDDHEFIAMEKINLFD